MHRNKIWIAFLTLITFAVIWFTWGTANKLKDYLTYTASSDILDINWKIHKINEEKYDLEAVYSYKIDDKIYQNKIIINQEIYQNPWAAEQAVTQQVAKKWKAWYDPNSPTHSTIVKTFPMKELISTAVLLGLWLYFIWLGFYVTRFYR